jgi:hypothetical protein
MAKNYSYKTVLKPEAWVSELKDTWKSREKLKGAFKSKE